MRKVFPFLAVLAFLVIPFAGCVSYPGTDLVSEANRLLEQGDLNQSLALFDQAIAINASNSDAWEGRGVVLHRMGKDEEAFEALNQSLALDPTSAHRWVVLGDVLLGMDRYYDAAQAYDQAISLDINTTLAWNGIGTAYYRMGKLPEARQFSMQPF